ncbi:MAG: AMP-binding protein, partial [Pseudomonadota bacterium]
MMANDDTLPKLLVSNFKRYGKNRIAMRFKDFGIWNEISWHDYYQNVKHISLGLVSLGLRRGDKVSIIGDNNPEWYWAEIATQAAGGISVGIFVDSLPHELKYIAGHSDSRFLFAKDQEQIDKFLQIKNELPEMIKAIYWDEKGLRNYQDPSFMSLQELMKGGEKYEKENPDHFEKSIEKGSSDDVAIISYTSGTTGLAKGAQMTFRGLFESTSNWLKVDPWPEDDDYLSYIPPSWITEQFLGITGGLLSGLYVNFPEEAETVHNDIREISPVVLMFGGKLWESIVSSVEAKIMDSSAFNRFFYRLGFKIGNEVMTMKKTGRKVNPLWNFLYFLANISIYRPLKDKFGLKKIKYAYTAGAAVSPDVLKFFHTIGVNLKQLYGLTETGINTCHRDGDVNFGTVGPTLPGSEIKITPDGEIAIRSTALFIGYYKDQEA